MLLIFNRNNSLVQIQTVLNFECNLIQKNLEKICSMQSETTNYLRYSISTYNILNFFSMTKIYQYIFIFTVYFLSTHPHEYGSVNKSQHHKKQIIMNCIYSITTQLLWNVMMLIFLIMLSFCNSSGKSIFKQLKIIFFVYYYEWLILVYYLYEMYQTG